MFLHQVDLTTALRPSLLPGETLLYVQDAVGLYEGKSKIPQYQNGHVYLTTYRICYVDNQEPRQHSVAIELKDVDKDRVETYAGFIKSSAKISLYSKPKRGLTQSHTNLGGSAQTRSSPIAGTPIQHGSPLRSATPAPASSSTSTTWICPICSFANPVPSNFDPATANSRTPLPPCLACGIKPPLITIIKAALGALSNRMTAPVSTGARDGSDQYSLNTTTSSLGTGTTSSLQCPRCTFQNHPSLKSCEICGASLITARNNRLDLEHADVPRADSPGPILESFSPQDGTADCIKLSFRSGGDKLFHERLQNALKQRAWLLQNAPPIPKPSHSQDSAGSSSTTDQSNSGSAHRPRGIGIAGLERRGLEQMKNNEVMIGNAFEDLEALMASGKEIIALAESFASQANLNTNGASEADAVLIQSLSELGLATTRDKLNSKSESLYISELSRNLAEFLTDDKRGILRKEGGIMTLVDLWAVFNRARGGVELISPADFEKAAQLWDTLRLPVRLRRFKSGLLAVQGRERTDDKTIASILEWLKQTHWEPPSKEVPWDWTIYGRGVTAQEVAEQFGWSVGVATEELEMAEEKGALCRDQNFDGLRFWENWLVWDPS